MAPGRLRQFLVDHAVLVKQPMVQGWDLDDVPVQLQERLVSRDAPRKEANMTEEEKLARCAGCRDDFYNDKNPLGVKRCWCLERAELVLRKEVHRDQVPPWKQEPKDFLSCYNRDGYLYFHPDRER